MYKKSSKSSSIINFVKVMPKYMKILLLGKMKMLESIASLMNRNVREKCLKNVNAREISREYK